MVGSNLLFIDRRDLTPVLAVGEQQECRLEIGMFESGRRVDAEGDRSWCVCDRPSRHC